MTEVYFLSLSGQGSLDITPCYSDHYTRLELHFFKMFGYFLFYGSSLLLHPSRIWILLRDIMTGQGTTRLSIGLLNVFRRAINRGKIPGLDRPFKGTDQEKFVSAT